MAPPPLPCPARRSPPAGTPSQSLAAVARLNASSPLVANTSYSSVLTDVMEGPDYSVGRPYCSKMSAFFVAPRDSNYTFHVAADDYAVLNGTWTVSAVPSCTQCKLQGCGNGGRGWGAGGRVAWIAMQVEHAPNGARLLHGCTCLGQYVPAGRLAGAQSE